MRFRLALPSLLAAVILAGGAALPPQPVAQAPASSPSQNPAAIPPATKPQQPKITVTTALVHLVATVTDHHHKLVTDLGRSDFSVLEDGVPRPIEKFERPTNLPLRIALLLDTSNSIRPRFSFEQNAAIDFLDDVMLRHRDVAFLMTFDSTPQVIQDFTGDLGDLTEAIQKQRAGGGTALWDAVYKASEKLAHAPLPSGEDAEVRRIIVVLTDGEDNMSDRSMEQAVEAAERSDVSLYGISTNNDWVAVDGKAPEKNFKSKGEHLMEQFADQTGGRAFFPYSLDDLSLSFQNVSEELRSQYFMAYSPAGHVENGQYRKIEIHVNRPGLIVHARHGYYARAASPSSAPPGSK